MDTLVTIEVVDPPVGDSFVPALKSAFAWFDEVEACCSRFDATSELRQLAGTVGETVAVSPLLFRAIEFAVAVAQQTEGEFDPTVGGEMLRKGFDTNYVTGERVLLAVGEDPRGTYRDIVLDSEAKTVTLLRPLVLDLGAVAKGLAVDLAALALRDHSNFAINAGGDLYFGGTDAQEEPWTVGIRHPRRANELVDLVRVSGMAVCTSGDYERVGREANGRHHILNGNSGESAVTAISATVIAPTAMLADALATAAFVLGPVRGTAFLENQGVDGMLISADLERLETNGFGKYRV